MRIFLSFVFAMVFMIAGATPSHALVEGCDPDVWEATKATAEGRVAYDVAVSEEVSNQPDSVLALSCADQAFRVGASEGGSIFSGDFTQQMTQVVNQPLQDLLSSNFVASVGNSAEFSNVVGNYLGTLLGDMFPSFFSGGSFDCNVMQDLFDDVVTAGIDDSAEFLGLDEMVSRAMNGSSASTFLTNLIAEGPGGAFDEMLNARAALPVHSIPSFGGARTFNDVLQQAGIMQQ